MASLGVATVFPDKRGSGASGGDWLDGGYELLADDALATVAHLRRSLFDGVDALVGLVGLSEGGRVAPIAASRPGGGVDFVVSVSSGVLPFLETLDHEIRNTYREWGLTGEETADFLAVDAAVVRFAETAGAVEWAEYEEKLETVLGGAQAERARRLYPTSTEDKRWRWFRQVMHYEPLTRWQAVDAPAFFAMGEEDEAGNVPVHRSIELLESARGSKPDWEIHSYPGSGHGMWEPGQKGRSLNLAFQRDLRRFVERVLEPR
jgi:pimeloyl-ACP methyl ester carboxylesterase